MKKSIVFILTFIGYLSVTSIRYGWSYSKPQLNRETDISMKAIGMVDSFYIGLYSVGMVVLGSLMHKISPKNYVIMGLSISSISYMLYPIIFNFTHIKSVILLLFFMSFNGFFQATGWPGLMGIVGNEFRDNKKGILMAFWAMSGNFGNIYASTTCNILEISGFSIIYNYLATGLPGIVVSILIYIYLSQNTKEQKKQQPRQIELNLLKNQQKITQKTQNETDKYGIFSLFKLPNVTAYVIGYACLKGCIYGMGFWLPTFLSLQISQINSQKGFISAMVDIGTICGALSIGYFADLYEKRALFLSPLLFLGAILMFLVNFVASELWHYYLIMFLIGICAGGPYNVIATVITIDLGTKINNKEGITKISSLIQGFGSFFTAVSMMIIPFVSFGYILFIFAFQCLVAMIALWPLFMEQLKSVVFVINKQMKFVKQQEYKGQYEMLQIKTEGQR